jgi:hypothetical protein
MKPLEAIFFLFHPNLYEQLGCLICTPSCLFNYTIEHNYHGARFDTPILFWVGELGDPTSGRWQASISTHVNILNSGNTNALSICSSFLKNQTGKIN